MAILEFRLSLWLTGKSKGFAASEPSPCCDQYFVAGTASQAAEKCQRVINAVEERPFRAA